MLKEDEDETNDVKIIWQTRDNVTDRDKDNKT